MIRVISLSRLFYVITQAYIKQTVTFASKNTYTNFVTLVGPNIRCDAV